MITCLAEYFARRSREKREKTIRKLCEKDFHLAKRTCFACAPSGWQAASRRGMSVGCDDENFSSPKEYEANGEVIRCSQFREICEIRVRQKIA